MKPLQAINLAVCVFFAQIGVAGAQPAQSEVDPVALFQAFVVSANAETDKSTYVYQAPNKLWFRAYAAVSELRYDIRKTDSLIAPLAAEVRFLLRSQRSNAYDAMPGAEAAREISVTPANMIEVFLRYAWRDGAWHFEGGERATWFDVPGDLSLKSRSPITGADALDPKPVSIGPWLRSPAVQIMHDLQEPGNPALK